MRMGRVVAAVVVVPAAALVVSVAVQHRPGPMAPVPAVVSSAPAVPGPAGTAAGKGGTVAKAIAGRAVYHLVPHVPYVFRPRVFRGGLLRRY